MRISDWSSDVCSSDLIIDQANEIGTAEFARHMPEYCGVISVNPKTAAKRGRVEHEEKEFDMAVLERALENARLVPIDRVIDELGQDIQIEEVGEAMAGQIIIEKIGRATCRERVCKYV